MIRALLALLLPPVAVWLSLLALGLRRREQSRTITAVAAFGCGVGLSSVTTFWLMAHVGLTGASFVASDALLWTTVAGLAWRRLRAVTRVNGDRTAVGSPSHAARLTPTAWIACALFGLVAAVALGTTVTEYMAAPHGQWDAWAVWNQKARFLVRAGSRWTDSLVIPWSNPSHPLLVPTSVARLWSYAGAELTVVPAMFSLSLGIGIVAAVIGALDPRRSRSWLAGAVVVAPSTFVELVASQMADLPTSFFVVAALVVFFNVRGEPGSTPINGRGTGGSLLLGVMLAGFAAWTKNEGLVLVAVVLLVAAWRVWSERRLQSLMWVIAGAVVPLASIAWLKLNVSTTPPGYFSESDTAWVLLDRVVSLDRHQTIAGLVSEYWFRWGGPGAAGLLPFATAALVVAAARRGRASRAIAATVATMVAAYYASWLLTPIDFQWLLTTSFDRLLAQLWPSMVIASFSPPAASARPASRAEIFASGMVGKDNSGAE